MIDLSNRLEPHLGEIGSICTKTGVNDEDRTTDDTIYRQAAIDIVRNRVKRFTTACVLAVTEIEQLPSAQPETHDKRTETHACDLISRQAAIDGIKKEMLERDGRFYKGLLVANHVIVHLPPAQAVGDMISRQQAIEAFEPEHSTDWYTPNIIEVLEALPPVQRMDCCGCRHGYPLGWSEVCIMCRRNYRNYKDRYEE